MIKYTPTFDKTVMCDRCEKNSTESRAKRIPIGTHREYDGCHQNEDVMDYVDLCENCILQFVYENNLSSKLKNFIK